MKYIRLTQGKETLVDDEDYSWLNQWSWYYAGEYAKRTHRDYPNAIPQQIQMHRLINGTPDGMDTDHINGDKLDNRRINLRAVTHQQNGLNRGKQSDNKSGYKGVCWHKKNGKWYAQISINKRKIYLGQYDTVDMAAKAYSDAAKKYHGKFARAI